MLSVHWRMAELWTLERQRGLTESEEAELSACLHYNAVYARKLAGLYNLSLAASMTRDTEWQHEICRQIERLEEMADLSY
ncbi:hypothetical protein RAC89_17495 [Paenibacillus sp. GD4]|jgi:hypothetical protein|uniref:DUF7667 family protein n=1 Tax=Paenibacillus sp. GD4 TaxID=3068890 RepID=UPI0027968525|nr:hypothetical protein [Paenibacillus sp. GD4]MDQ1912184.1 hypothetical protein [Paenibacillus sp. GD4]